MAYILDTNAINDLMNDDQETKENLARAIASGKEVYLNGISYWEKKRGFLRIGATKKLEIFNRFCKKFGILLLDEMEIFEIASKIHADLSKSGRILEDADILIASIALCKDKTLVTRDGHFGRVDGLKTENWEAEA